MVNTTPIQKLKTNVKVFPNPFVESARFEVEGEYSDLTLNEITKYRKRGCLLALSTLISDGFACKQTNKTRKCQNGIN